MTDRKAKILPQRPSAPAVTRPLAQPAPERIVTRPIGTKPSDPFPGRVTR